MFGFFNINKESGITSSSIVYKLRKILKIKQIGHVGTLDPLASGVLPIAIGKATRIIEFLPNTKSYIATLQFGKTSDTYDSQGIISITPNFNKISEEQFINLLPKFIGYTMQTPPMFSAIKVNGKKLYEYARKGQTIPDLKPRKIFISSIQCLSFDYDNQIAKISVECNCGVYIRSLIKDIGDYFHSGAIMIGLIRSSSNGFDISNAISVDELSSNIDNINNYLLDPLDYIPFDKFNLNKDEYIKISHGQSLNINGSFSENQMLSLIYENKCVGIATILDNILKVKKVFI